MKKFIFFLVCIIGFSGNAFADPTKDFFDALSNGNNAKGLALLQKNKIDQKRLDPLFSFTALQLSCNFGTKAMIDLCIKQGADIHYGRDKHQTPIMLGWGILDKMNVLLDHGASVKDTDDNGNNVLHNYGASMVPEAINLNVDKGFRSKLVKTLERVIKMGGDVNLKNKKGETPLYTALQHADPAVIDLYLKAGADVRVITNDKRNMLFAAAFNTNGAKFIIDLIAQGLEVNARDDEKYTPISMAMNKANAEAFIKAGADLKMRSSTGITLLHLARPAEVIQLFFKNGADIEARDNNDNTPLLSAADERTDIYVDTLLKLGANIHAVNGYGWNCLHKAAFVNSPRSVKLLLKYKMDKNVPTTQEARRGIYTVPAGSTAMDIAQKAGSTKAIDALK